MTEKYYCEDYDEYLFNTENTPYRIYDLTKSNKTKEDFYDNEKECYDIAAFEEYLRDNDCMLTSDQVKDRLIKQEEKIKQLKCKLNYYEHKFASFNQEKENLVSEIKNRIKYLQQTEFKYMETERLISIMELKWMLDLISSGSCEVYETKKIIDEIK